MQVDGGWAWARMPPTAAAGGGGAAPSAAFHNFHFHGLPLSHLRPKCVGSQDVCLPACLQLHLAFAGPASYAVTWVTHPLKDAALAAAIHEAAADLEEPLATTAGSRQLAAAGGQQQAHLGAGQADGLERRHKRRRKHSCAHVVAAAARSVVQYGTASGEYTHTGAHAFAARRPGTPTAAGNALPCAVVKQCSPPGTRRALVRCLSASIPLKHRAAALQLG